jgi:hypothetical protein
MAPRATVRPVPEVHICVRRTLDWADEAHVAAHIDARFRAKLETWNATVDPPYHRFRQRVKEIAALNLSRVEGAVLSTLDATPPGAIVVPVDDDDWFAPQLATRLRAEHEPGREGYYWRRLALEPRPWWRKIRLRYWLGLRRDPFTCKTNGYAMVDGPVHLLMDHPDASVYFDEHPAAVKRIAATLAIQNRNLASQTTLGGKLFVLDRERLVRALERYRGLYRSYWLRPGLRWARPYVDLMAELMDDVRVR